MSEKAEPVSQPVIQIADEYPVVGKETTIVLPAPAEEVVLTYQPGAPISDTQTLEAGGETEVLWTPEQAGVVSIESGGVSKNVSVKFDGMPLLGIIIFIAAGAILFGGAVTCLRALFSESREQ